VAPNNVWLQSFDKNDILYWVRREPAFGARAAYLDNAQTPMELPTAEDLISYKTMGINIVAPPIFALLAMDSSKNVVPSQYAKNAKAAKLDIVAWTLERSGLLTPGKNGFYYQTVEGGVKRDGDVLKVLDVLAKQVGIIGIFSDWPGTVTF